ncbi:MAG: alcohol dehydrogenase catalytic domain-containing protein [Thermodesulfovibrionia bacterium]|nr:alcohol dehydrogenase catalytic domain-containing protein [Thermodesulfovibrionia bacterium]
MRALVFHKKRLKYISDYPLPRRGRNEALIKVTHAGICNTDIEITRGYIKFEGVPGHEFVGIVERCSQKNLIGKRVVGEINITCGHCSFCKEQMQNHCPDRSVLGIFNKDGVFAEYITLPVRNLHLLPDSISSEEAVFIEPLAAVFEITRQVEIMPYHKVCVLGDGKLGLLAGQVISLKGCDLMVVGRHKDKLSLLKKRGIKTELCSQFNKKGFDIVVDCTGSPTGIETALQIVRPGGKVIVKTTTARKTEVDLNAIVVNELTLIGSRCGPFPWAIKAMERGNIDIKPFISKRFSLQDGVKAFKYTSKRNVLKVLLAIA